MLPVTSMEDHEWILASKSCWISLRRGRIDRRTFMVRAFALGVTGSAVASGLSRVGLAAAQDEKASSIGEPDITHITDNRQGRDQALFLVAADRRLRADRRRRRRGDQDGPEDFGNAAGGFALEYEALDDGIAANNGGWDAGKEIENANQVDQRCGLRWSTWPPTTPAWPRSRSRSRTRPGWRMISYANTYPGLTKAIEGATEEGEPDIYYPTGKRNYMRVCPGGRHPGCARPRTGRTTSRARARPTSLTTRASTARVWPQVFNNSVRGAWRRSPRLRGLRSEGVRLPVADDLDRGHGSGHRLSSAPRSTTTPAKVLQDMRCSWADEVIFLGPDGLINQAFVDGAGDAAEARHHLRWLSRRTSCEGRPGADYVDAHHARSSVTRRMPTRSTPTRRAVVVIQAIDKVGEKDRGKILDAMFATEGS